MGAQSPATLATTPLHPRVAVLGVGRAGSDLIALLEDAGVDVIVAWNRSPRAPVGRVAVRHGPLPDLAAADAVILAVSDGHIGRLARRLTGLLRPGTVLLHLAGAVPSSILAGAGSRVVVGSMHPLQALVGDGAPPRPFPWILEGHPRAVALARGLADAMGCPSHVIAATDKPRYHLAATMASNLLVALLDASSSQAQRTGLPAGELPDMLLPLMRTTLEHAARLGPRRALTGPVRRGDASTVRDHMRQLSGSELHRDAYRALSLIALDLAAADGLGDDDARAILDALGAAGACVAPGND